MEDKFKLILTVIIILGIFGLILSIFSNIYVQQVPSLVASGSAVITNATQGVVFVAGDRLKNNTRLTLRTTPDNSFRCTRVNWGYSGGINNGSNGIKQLNISNFDATKGTVSGPGVVEALCTYNGTIRLFLAGNASNGSTLDGRGKHFNVSYTANGWTAAFNVSNAQQNAIYSATGHSSIYYALLVLAIILAVVTAYLGIQFGTGGFGGGSGEGGGFDIGNPLDHFKR